MPFMKPSTASGASCAGSGFGAPRCLRRGPGAAAKRRSPRLRRVGLCVALGLGATSAEAQSLDELLGIEEPAAPAVDAPEAAEEPEVPDAAEADKAPGADIGSLTAADALERVITEMAEATALLEAGETGLETQRLQQRVIDRLEQVIAAASQPQGGGGQGGGEGNPQNQDQQPGQQGGQQGGQPQPGEQAGQQPGAASAGAPQSGAGAGGDAQASTGGAADAELADRPLDELRSEWGGLPPRLRDALSEGLDEPYSPTWREATEAYYRRLAEESNR